MHMEKLFSESFFWSFYLDFFGTLEETLKEEWGIRTEVEALGFIYGEDSAMKPSFRCVF